MSRFSIITVTKHDPEGLARTRASIEAQRFEDYEWIVQDGALTPDAGIYDAMNKGMARAGGDYLIFMNGGDCFAGPDSLTLLAGHDADFIYGDAFEGGHYKRARHDIARGMVTHHQAMAYRRAALGGLRYDTRFSIAADYDFTARFLMRTQSRAYIPAALCVFETGGISQQRTTLGRCEQARIRRELRLSSAAGAWWTEMGQRAAQMLRAHLPRLYWALRALR